MNRTLVAYFSASGSTARLAKTLASAAGAALYEIRPRLRERAKGLDRGTGARLSAEKSASFLTAGASGTISGRRRFITEKC